MFSISSISSIDYEIFAEFFIENNLLHHTNQPLYFIESIDPKELKDHFDKIISDINFISFKYVVDNEVKGIIYGYHFITNPNLLLCGRNYVQIQNIFVKPEYRNQGIGKKLMNRIEEEAKKKGIPFIELIVWNFNQSAANLYTSIGYESKLTRMTKSIKKF